MTMDTTRPPTWSMKGDGTPMTAETNVTARPEFVDKTSSRVRVFTPSGVLEGSHHHPPGIRLSDMLRNQASSEKYMLLTDVSLTSNDGTRWDCEFVLVNTQHASLIVPLEESAAATIEP